MAVVVEGADHHRLVARLSVVDPIHGKLVLFHIAAFGLEGFTPVCIRHI